MSNMKRSGEFLGNTDYQTGDAGSNIGGSHPGPNPPGTKAIAWGEDGVSEVVNRGFAAATQNTDFLDWLLHQELASPTRIRFAVPPTASIPAFPLDGPVILRGGKHYINLNHSDFDSLFPAWSDRVFHGDDSWIGTLQSYFTLVNDDDAELVDPISSYAVLVDEVFFPDTWPSSLDSVIGLKRTLNGPNAITAWRRHGIEVNDAGFIADCQPGNLITVAGGTPAELNGDFLIRRVDPGNNFVELMRWSDSNAPTESEVETASEALIFEDAVVYGTATLQTNKRFTKRPYLRLNYLLPTEISSYHVTLKLGLGRRFPWPVDSLLKVKIRDATDLADYAIYNFLLNRWEDTTAHEIEDLPVDSLEGITNFLLALGLQEAYDESSGASNPNPTGTGRVIDAAGGALEVRDAGTAGDAFGDHGSTAVRVRGDGSNRIIGVDVESDSAYSCSFLWRSKRYGPLAVITSGTDTITLPAGSYSDLYATDDQAFPSLIEIETGDDRGLYIPTAYDGSVTVTVVSLDTGAAPGFTGGAHTADVYQPYAHLGGKDVAPSDISSMLFGGRTEAFCVYSDSKTNSAYSVTQHSLDGGNRVTLFHVDGYGAVTVGGKTYLQDTNSSIKIGDRGEAQTDQHMDALLRIALARHYHERDTKRATVVLEMPPSYIAGNGPGVTDVIAPLSAVETRFSLADGTDIFYEMPITAVSGSHDIDLGGAYDLTTMLGDASGSSFPWKVTDIFVELFDMTDKSLDGVYRLDSVSLPRRLTLKKAAGAPALSANFPVSSGSCRLFIRDVVLRGMHDQAQLLNLIVPSLKDLGAYEPQDEDRIVHGIQIRVYDPMAFGGYGRAIHITGEDRINAGNSDGPLVVIDANYDGGGSGTAVVVKGGADTDLASLFDVTAGDTPNDVTRVFDEAGDIIFKTYADDTDKIGNRIEIGDPASSKTQKDVFAADIEGSCRTQYGHTQATSLVSTLDGLPIFPMHSGRRSLIPRSIPVRTLGFDQYGIGELWEASTPGIQVTTPIGLNTSKYVRLPIDVKPGMLLNGCHIWASSTVSSDWGFAIRREIPQINNLAGGPAYVGFMGPNQNSNAIHLVTTPASFSGIKHVELEFPRDLFNTIPTWVSGLSVTIPSPGAVPTYQLPVNGRYQVRIVGGAGLVTQILSHSPDLVGGSYDLTSLDVPFMGDYLVIRDAAGGSGIYPIIASFVSGANLELGILAAPNAITATGTFANCFIPAFVNPCSDIFVRAIVINGGVGSVNKLTTGVAHIRDYNDLAACGFPFTPDNPGGFGP